MCAYQGVRNISFSENFAHALNERSFVKSAEYMDIQQNKELNVLLPLFVITQVFIF